MKRPWENDIFTNPEGWAGKAVGTLWRYRFMQALTIFGGISLFLIFVLTRRDGYVHYLGVVVLMGVFTIAFPLMYLRALRCLYIKSQHIQNNHQVALPDRR